MDNRMMRRALPALTACLLSGVISAGFARAADVDQISIGGGATMATYIGQNKGFYAEQRIEIVIPRLPSSDAVRDALAKGSIQMADFSVDNALSMAEKRVADVIVIMGNENQPIQFVGNKNMTSVDQLRGKAVLVDSPVTQNAVIMKRILEKQGLLADRDYQMKVSGGEPLRLAELRRDPSLGGTMVSWPEFFQMRADGYPAFGSSLDVIGPMTFRVIFTTREWAASHRDLVVRFITAQLKSQRWMTDPKNKDEVIQLLIKSRGFTPEVASSTYEAFMGPNGWVRDGAIRLPDLARVMQLRAEVEGGWGGNPPPPETYVDLSYLNEAAKAVDGK